jgi:hypothetical protein
MYNQGKSKSGGLVSGVWEMKTMNTREAKLFFEKQVLSGLSRKTKTEIRTDQYLWHAFSFGKISCLEGKEADNAFNSNIYKSGFVFFQAGKDTDPVIPIPSAACTNSDIAEMMSVKGLPDIYVVDHKFRWVYVKTHEESLGCGPYFYAVQKTTK